jgi:hypothetical protein
MAPWLWFLREPKHVGATVVILIVLIFLWFCNCMHHCGTIKSALVYLCIYQMYVIWEIFRLLIGKTYLLHFPSRRWFSPWRRRWKVSPKRLYPCSSLQGVTFLETILSLWYIFTFPTFLDPPNLLYNGYQVIPGRYMSRGMALTTHSCLAPRLKE